MIYWQVILMKYLMMYFQQEQFIYLLGLYNCVIPTFSQYIFTIQLSQQIKLSMTQVSQISISSNIASRQNKQYLSAKYEQSTQGGQASSRTFDCKSSVSKTTILNHQIAKIQQAQSQMQKKFQKCIEILIKQIQQKQSLNNKLVKEISDLKQNIEQSKKDIQTISSYVKKNVKSRNNEINRLTKQTSNKNIQSSGSIKIIKRSVEGNSPRKLLTKCLGAK